jgi:hypothetical protein
LEVEILSRWLASRLMGTETSRSVDRPARNSGRCCSTASDHENGVSIRGTRKQGGSFTASQGEENGTPNLIGLRDRALIAAMFFTFARVGAVVAMSVEDGFDRGMM